MTPGLSVRVKQSAKLPREYAHLRGKTGVLIRTDAEEPYWCQVQDESRGFWMERDNLEPLVKEEPMAMVGGVVGGTGDDYGKRITKLEEDMGKLMVRLGTGAAGPDEVRLNALENRMKRVVGRMDEFENETPSPLSAAVINRIEKLEKCASRIKPNEVSIDVMAERLHEIEERVPAPGLVKTLELELDSLREAYENRYGEAMTPSQREAIYRAIAELKAQMSHLQQTIGDMQIRQARVETAFVNDHLPKTVNSVRDAMIELKARMDALEGTMYLPSDLPEDVEHMKRAMQGLQTMLMDVNAKVRENGERCTERYRYCMEQINKPVDEPSDESVEHEELNEPEFLPVGDGVYHRAGTKVIAVERESGKERSWTLVRYKYVKTYRLMNEQYQLGCDAVNATNPHGLSATLVRELVPIGYAVVRLIAPKK